MAAAYTQTRLVAAGLKEGNMQRVYQGRRLLSSITSVRMACADKEISYNNLKTLIEKSKELLLVDVRSKDEVDRGRISGSIHIPVDAVEREFSLDADDFQEKYGKPKPQLDAADLVFHCQLGRRGAAATEKARSLGFKNARNYTGGYKEWSEKESK